jgi:hypothetical protein
MSNTDTNFNLNNQQVVNQQNPYQQYYQEYSPNFNPSPGVVVQVVMWNMLDLVSDC